MGILSKVGNFAIDLPDANVLIQISGAFGSRQEEAQRLLLRPCTDTAIERFFRYNDQGLILRKEGLNATEQKKVEESIKVYALQRLGLVQAREARVILIKAQLRRVENAIHNFNTYFDRSETDRIWFEGILRREMEILHRYKDPDQEYAGLARYIIDQYFYKLNH